MIDLSKLKKKPTVSLYIPNTEEIVDSKMVKKLRNEVFHMSQSSFAVALGVSEKTIEKWERGGKGNRINSSSKKLLYLLDRDHSLMDSLYQMIDETDGHLQSASGSFEYKYAIKTGNHHAWVGARRVNKNAPIITVKD